jgi:hypothetical protein
MISFLAYHGKAEQRHAVINEIAGYVATGHLIAGLCQSPDRLTLIGAIAGGRHDLALAHQACGFPAPLLLVAEALFEGLPPDEAPHFALALMKAAAVDVDLADVTRVFAEWMLAEAIATLRPATRRTTAKDAGLILCKLAEMGALSAVAHAKATAQSDKIRWRELEAPGDRQMLVTLAVSAILDNGPGNLGVAIYRMTRTSEAPSYQYRCYAQKLLELVETA